MVAENPRKTIYKISEIYDRIALAAAGRIAEYEALRVAGIRESEIKGFRYYREDVTAKWLTNLYSQHMGAVAQAWDAKPLEIELLVCEVAGSETAAGLQRNQIYHIAFDGIYSEEEKYAVIGGRATAITELLEQRYTDGLEMPAALRLVTETFQNIESDTDTEDGYEIAPDTIEVACLEQTAERRRFRRLSTDEVTALLS